MKRLASITTLAIALSLAFTITAAAAPAASTAVDINGSLQFNSILGGSTNGPVTLSGSASDAGLDTLRGTVNLPLRDERIVVAPTGTIVLQSQQLQIPWQRLVCQPYFCYWETGMANFERKFAQGPVDLRVGNLRGSGTLNLATDASCVSACAPAGAYYYYTPMGFTQISGGVTSSQDAGTVNIYGPAPIVH